MVPNIDKISALSRLASLICSDCWKRALKITFSGVILVFFCIKSEYMKMRVDMVTWTSLLVNVTTAIDEFLNTWTKLVTFHSNTVVLNINIFLFVNMKDKIKIKLCEFELQHNSFVNTLQILWIHLRTPAVDIGSQIKIMQNITVKTAALTM